MIMRIFVTRTVRICGYITIGVSFLWMLMTMLVALLLWCPVRGVWDSSIPGACENQVAGFSAVAGVDVFNEILLLLLPIRPLWNLHISKRYKVALAGVFASGIM